MAPTFGAVHPARKSPHVVATIVSALWSDPVVTLTTAEPHGLLPGDTVCVAGMLPAKYNGSYVALHGTDGDVIKYIKNRNPGAVTRMGSIRRPKPRRRPTQLLPTGPPVVCRLRLPDVLATVGCSKAHWYALIAEGKAPRPHRLPSSRISTWIADEVRAFLDGAYEQEMVTTNDE